jgi:DNA-directed RNA polymerase subunit RPC12/RpoP
MPEDMDIYMKKIKQRADETDNVMGKIKEDKMAELDKLRIENEMEEVRARLEENRAKIRESQKTGQVLAPQQAYNFAELLFAGRPPEEIKQIINSLTEEEIHKLAYMASAMNNNKLSEFREYMRQPSTSMKEVVEVVKLVTEIARPQQQQQGSAGEIAKSIVEAVKVGLEAGKAQNQPTQQTQDPMQIYKVVSEIIRPFQEETRAREKEANELRYKGLESKIINPVEYVKNIKTMASDLGMTSGGKSDVDLKLMEMAQTERLENRKIDYATQEREQKREDDKESTKQLYGLIGQVVGADGVVGKLAANLGSAAKTRIQAGSRQSDTRQGSNNPSLLRIGCPQCGKEFPIVKDSPQVACPNCSAVLALQQQTPQPQQPQVPQTQTQEQSSITQSTESQAPPPASESQPSVEGSQPAQEQPEQPK